MLTLDDLYDPEKRVNFSGNPPLRLTWLDDRHYLQGARKVNALTGGKGPDDKKIPALTPNRLKKWGDGELKDFLVTGITADGDVPAEAMAEVIRNTTSQLSPQDLDAVIAYLRSLPAARPSSSRRSMHRSPRCTLPGW